MGSIRDVWRAGYSVNGTVTPASILQQTQHYPSGLPWSEGTGVSTKSNKYNGKEFVEMNGLDTYDYGARGYYAAMGRFMTVDPLAEKYYNNSPYAYCKNNPINRIDPNGMDDYRYDDETGEFNLMKKTDDKTDRVLGYHLNKKTGEYEQNTKWYQTKTRMEGVEKGILSDGVNFQEKDNIISVGGKDQATVDGVKSFTLQLSEMVGKEIEGYSYSSNSSGKVTDMSLGNYKNNESDKSFARLNELQRKYGDNFSFNNVLQNFHTHPNGELGATLIAPELSKDVKSLRRDKPQLPNASFIILYRISGQIKPEEYDYTHEYKP